MLMNNCVSNRTSLNKSVSTPVRVFINDKLNVRNV